MKKKVTKKPHEVTQAFLRFWHTRHEDKLGVWVFDLTRQKIRFSTSFSFAEENYLYIPLNKGQRDEGVEAWFSSIEGAMIKLIRRLETESFADPIHGNELQFVLLGLVSLAYRSGYQVKKLRDAILSNSEWKKHFEVTSRDEAHLASVEIMLNMIIQQGELFYGGENSVLYNISCPLLICESPFFDMTSRGPLHAVGPITPSAAFMLDASRAQGGPSLSFAKAEGDNSKFCATLNDFTVMRARKWIVATSKEQLEKILPQLTPEKIAERKAKDKVVFIPPPEGQSAEWWTLKR